MGLPDICIVGREVRRDESRIQGSDVELLKKREIESHGQSEHSAVTQGKGKKGRCRNIPKKNRNRK